ncbi:MAG: GC-type dockerin domain-anchored protein [Phycisphaerales bacterium]|nr:GC-type dockerin domain-anchored protein [Phycisphaerales bacterium]
MFDPIGNGFGGDVAIDDGILAVSGFLPDFDENNEDYGSAHLFDVSTGVEIARLVAEDGHGDDGFGSSIDIDNGIVVVGAQNFKDKLGAVYLFDATTGEQLRKITPPDGDTDGSFGLSVAIDNGVVAVGAPIGPFSPATGSGYVYLFNAATGAQLHKLSSNDGIDGDLFGFSVDMDNGRLAVGAPFTNNPQFHTGALYVFSVSSGVQIQKFVPTSVEFGDNFGKSVASSGNRIAIGAPADGNNSETVGSVYIYDSLTLNQVSRIVPEENNEKGFGISVAFENDIVVAGASGFDLFSGSAFVFNATTGIQAVELNSDDLSTGDEFGVAVAIDGFNIAVGALREEHGGPTSGAAYIFSTFTGNQNEKVLPAQEDLAFDNFGYAVAADTSVVVVSANKNDERGDNAGAAYLYDSTNGDLLTTYLPDSGTHDGNFGYSLDYDSAIVAVGAPGDSANGTNSGAAYLYFAFTGDRIRKLVPTDGNAGDFFGASVALDTGFNGGILAVGSSFDDDNGTDSGSVYLYQPFTGVQLGKIYASDATVGDLFGNAVAMDDGTLVVGAYRESELGFRSGAAYLFDLETNTQIAKLLPSDGAGGDFFGTSVAIHNGIVAVGAWAHDQNGTDSGAVYLFDATTGEQLAKFTPSDASAEDRFGFSVSIYNGAVLIGSYRDNENGLWSGSAYLFGASSGDELFKLLPSSGSAQDLFGRSVSIHLNNIGVGALGDSRFGTNAGAAYVFSVPDGICPADLTDDGTLNFFDVSEFLIAFSLKEPIGDYNNDGSFDFFDISAFLADFANGCP